MIQTMRKRVNMERRLMAVDLERAELRLQELQAQRELGADQVLFAPGGDIQETGAANFVLIEGDELLTKPVNPDVLRARIVSILRKGGPV